MVDRFSLRRRTWSEINLDDALYNLNVIKNACKAKICCVVKGNAYGHGAVKMAELYEKSKVDYLAVSNVEEALQLRHANIRVPILILGYTPPECAGLLEKYDISQCVYSLRYAEALNENIKGYKIKIHIKLDTGMGRIGFLCRDKGTNELEDVVKVCNMSTFIHEGIFMHFAIADDTLLGQEFTRNQYNSFCYGIQYLENLGILFDIHHCANSAAIFDYPQYHMDMVRAGIVLYGLTPSEKLRNPPYIKPVMSLKSVISHIKSIKMNESIGYGREFIACKDMRIATIPIGYADGFWRCYGCGNYAISIHGSPAPIIGRICMDQMMVDITGIDCNVGDEVTIFGKDSEYNIDSLAKHSGTINYEIICAVGERVPRAYRINQEIIDWQDNICDFL